MEPIVQLDRRVTVLETQVARIVSDIESEKMTRSDSNAHLFRQISEIHTHLKDQDKFQNRSLGALIVVNVIIVPVVIAILLKLVLYPIDKLY